MITGGAGFIGSHLVDTLMKRKNNFNRLIVLDDLSSGNLENISSWLKHPKFKFIQWDLTKNLFPKLEANFDLVIHLAANPNVRFGTVDNTVDFNQNVLATYNILRAVPP